MKRITVVDRVAGLEMAAGRTHQHVDGRRGIGVQRDQAAGDVARASGP
jgi:hypothetical protein